MTDGSVGQFNLRQGTDFAGPALSVDGATLRFEVNSTGVDRLNVSGSVQASGVNVIDISGVENGLSPGATYTIVSAQSGLSGDFTFANGANAMLASAGGQTCALFLADSDTAVTIHVMSAKFWIGGVSADWDTSTANWAASSGSSSTTAFANGSVAVFDDAAHNFDVNVAADIVPAATFFVNTSARDYTVARSYGYGIGGNGPLIVQGGGTVTITGTESLSGQTTITPGSSLQLGDGVSASGSVAGSIANNGILILSTPGGQTIPNAINGTGSVIVNGPGVATMTGSNTYTGPTFVNGGQLNVDAVTPSPVTINDGGTLGGTGGTGPVTQNGGVYLANVYKVQVVDSALQEADGDAANTGSLSLAQGQNGLVQAISEQDAVFRALSGFAVSDDGTHYELTGAGSPRAFSFHDELVLDDGQGGIVDEGQAITFNFGSGSDSGGVSSGGGDTPDDFFRVNVSSIEAATLTVTNMEALSLDPAAILGQVALPEEFSSDGADHRAVVSIVDGGVEVVDGTLPDQFY